MRDKLKSWKNRIPSENYENNENHRITNDNNWNHENLIISHDNIKNQVNQRILNKKYFFFKIMEFQFGIATKKWKSYKSI